MEEQKKENVEKKEEKVTDAEVVSESTESKKNEPATEAQSGNKNAVFAFFAGMLVAVIGYFILQGGMPQNSGVASDTIDPTAVVAEVNGEALYGEALTTQMQQIVQISGGTDIAELDPESYEIVKSQSVDALINSELIAQAATEAGFEVTDEEAEEEYQVLIEQIGGEEAATARFEALGTSVEDFMEDLHRDLLIQKYMLAQVGDATITDEEIESTYAELSETLGENAPELEVVREQIRAQLEAEQQQAELRSILEGLREEADIEIRI